MHYLKPADIIFLEAPKSLFHILAAVEYAHENIVVILDQPVEYMSALVGLQRALKEREDIIVET
jgi:hypothetical protein